MKPPRHRPWLLACAVGLVAAGCNEKQSDVPTQPSAGASSSLAANPSAPTSASSTAAAASAKPGEAVGTAKLEDDGTLVLTLYTRGPIHGQLQKRYTKGDPERERVLEHIGGLEPGEEKLVPPWPDDIDDARVDAAVKEHIAKQSWAADARITVTGTDAQGRIAVTVVNSRPEGGGFALRLDPKSYAVVEENPLPTTH